MKHYEDDLVYRVVELLFEQRGEGKNRLKMEVIAGQLKKEFPQHPELTRESLYPLGEEAVRRGFIRLTPPVIKALRQKLVAKFPGLARTKVNVVETAGPADNARVAAVAADKALAALLRFAKAKGGEPVGLGLGPGRATLQFCHFLSARLKLLDEDLKLRLVAITASCPVRLLEYAPISFLNLFPERFVESKLGLFAETLVPAGQFKALCGHTGIKQAFASDPHDLRAVTVFELKDLVDLALKPDKEVILMARQCGLCARAHTAALSALLSNPSLGGLSAGWCSIAPRRPHCSNNTPVRTSAPRPRRDGNCCAGAGPR
jgi:hypothetical protein